MFAGNQLGHAFVARLLEDRSPDRASGTREGASTEAAVLTLGGGGEVYAAGEVLESFVGALDLLVWELAP